jgi:hypothetical protein
MSTENKQSLEARQVEAAMAIPKSSVGIFELPCGYLAPDGELITEVKVREITGVEEDMLAAKNISGGKKITQLLGSCLERLGPMTDKPFLIQCARQLLIGDRSFLMMAIRRVTLGDDFPFTKECPKCEKESLFTVNLGQLDIRKMPDPKKRVYDEVLPSGKKVRWHCMSGKEEEAMSKVNNADALSAALLVRLDMINDGPPGMSLIKSMSMKDREWLRERFDETEGGVDTTIQNVCPACGAEFEDQLDVGQTGFFFPSRILKRSNKNISSS